MNNEPVAWMQVHHKDNKPTKFSLVQTWEDDIPLYTHPVKELTDEEILESAEGAGCVFDYSYKGEVTFISKNALKRFVVEILRKATKNE